MHWLHRTRNARKTPRPRKRPRRSRRGLKLPLTLAETSVSTPRAFPPQHDPSQVQYYSNVRFWCDPAFRTLKRTTAGYDAAHIVSPASAISYVCGNTYSAKWRALRRTAVAPQKCDLPFILPDGAIPMTTIMVKCVDPLLAMKELTGNRRVSRRVNDP